MAVMGIFDDTDIKTTDTRVTDTRATMSNQAQAVQADKQTKQADNKPAQPPQDRVQTKSRKGAFGQGMGSPTTRLLLPLVIVLLLAGVGLFSVMGKKSTAPTIEDSSLMKMTITHDNQLNEGQREYAEDVEVDIMEQQSNDGSSTMSFSQSGYNLLYAGGDYTLESIPVKERLYVQITENPNRYQQLITSKESDGSAIVYFFDKETKSLYDSEGNTVSLNGREQVLASDHVVQDITAEQIQNGEFAVSSDTYEKIEAWKSKQKDQRQQDAQHVAQLTAQGQGVETKGLLVDETALAQLKAQAEQNKAQAEQAKAQNTTTAYTGGDYGGGDYYGGGYGYGTGGNNYPPNNDGTAVPADGEWQPNYNTTSNNVRTIQNEDGSITSSTVIPFNSMATGQYENAKRRQLMNNLEQQLEHDKQARLGQVGQLRTSQQSIINSNINGALGVIDERKNRASGFNVIHYPTSDNTSTATNTAVSSNTATTATPATNSSTGEFTVRRGTKWRAIVLQEVDTARGENTVTARLVDGMYAGATLWGNVEVIGTARASNIGVKWHTVIPANKRQPSVSINARALSLTGKNFGSTAVATKVNHHHIRNYTGAILESGLEGYGTAYKNNTGQSTVVNTATGTTISVSDGEVTKQEIRGAVADSLSQRLKSDVSRIGNMPTTYEIAIGTPLEVELLDDLVIKN